MHQDRTAQYSIEFATEWDREIGQKTLCDTSSKFWMVFLCQLNKFSGAVNAVRLKTLAAKLGQITTRTTPDIQNSSAWHKGTGEPSSQRTRSSFITLSHLFGVSCVVVESLDIHKAIMELPDIDDLIRPVKQ